MKRVGALGAGLALALSAAPALAEKITEPSTGTTFETEATYNGGKYTCLAAGVRKKLFIKVYAVAFCVEAGKGDEALAGAKKAGSADSQAFFDALRDFKGAHAVDMAFAREVEKGKIAEAFKETLGKALGEDDKDGQEKFLALVNRDVKAGEHIVLTSTPDGVLHLSIAGNDQTVTDAKVARYIWNAWLGSESVAPALKEALTARAK